MEDIGSLVKKLDLWSKRFRKMQEHMPESHKDRLRFLSCVMGRRLQSGAYRIGRQVIPDEPEEEHYGKLVAKRTRDDYNKIKKTYNKLLSEYEQRKQEIVPVQTFQHETYHNFKERYLKVLEQKPYIGEVECEMRRDWRIGDEKHAIATFWFYEPGSDSQGKYGFVMHIHKAGFTTDIDQKREDAVERYRQYIMNPNIK